MHCAINAVCENVPTIFLSYSQKSICMCTYVYGNDKWVINIREMDKKLIRFAHDMLKDKDEIAEFLQLANKRILDSSAIDCKKL